MVIIAKRKDTTHVFCNLFRFRRDRILVDGSVFFRCVARNCCGRVKVSVIGSVLFSSEHNHEAHPVRKEIDKVVAEIDREAVGLQKP